MQKLNNGDLVIIEEDTYTGSLLEFILVLRDGDTYDVFILMQELDWMLIYEDFEFFNLLVVADQDKIKCL